MTLPYPYGLLYSRFACRWSTFTPLLTCLGLVLIQSFTTVTLRTGESRVVPVSIWDSTYIFLYLTSTFGLCYGRLYKKQGQLLYFMSMSGLCYGRLNKKQGQLLYFMSTSGLCYGRLNKKQGQLLYFMSMSGLCYGCLLYTSPSPRDATLSRMPSSA